MNQILNMIMRQLVRRLVNAGITKGVDVVAKRKAGDEELTPEQQRAVQQDAKRARKAMRVARRAGR